MVNGECNNYLISFTNNISTLRVPKNNPLTAYVHQLFCTVVFLGKGKILSAKQKSKQILALHELSYKVHPITQIQQNVVFIATTVHIAAISMYGKEKGQVSGIAEPVPNLISPV